MAFIEPPELGVPRSTLEDIRQSLSLEQPSMGDTILKAIRVQRTFGFEDIVEGHQFMALE